MGDSAMKLLIVLGLSSILFLCLSLPSYAISTTELLYTLGSYPSDDDSSRVTVYSINKTTAVATALGHFTVPALYNIYVFHAPTAPFLYVLGFLNDNTEHIWTYKLNASGVPIGGPIQDLPVKNALTQFFIHPNGKLAYAVFSWTATDPNTGNPGFYTKAVLFAINPTTGLLTNTKKTIFNAPVNDNWQTTVLRLNAKDTEVITKMRPYFSGGDTYYLRGQISTVTGAITTPKLFWQDTFEGGVTGVGDVFMARSNVDPTSGGNVIDAYLNAHQPNVLIHCNTFMVQACGDSIYSLMFDPTGKYLLFNDSSTNQLVVIYVSEQKTQLIESGATIPGSPYLTTFSPDGLMLYTLENGQVLFYVFDPHSGLFTAKSAVTDPYVYQLTPAEKHRPSN
jgi:hypothetical protein